MLFALTFLIQFSNKKQNKNLNFDTSDIHLLQILCNFVQSIFNIKYDTWYIFLFLFFKSQLIRRILRYMKLQRIKWSVQWIIYSDMEIEEKKQEHSNTWIVHEKSARYQSQRTWFVPQGLIVQSWKFLGGNHSTEILEQ